MSGNGDGNPRTAAGARGERKARRIRVSKAPRRMTAEPEATHYPRAARLTRACSAPSEGAPNARRAVPTDPSNETKAYPAEDRAGPRSARPRLLPRRNASALTRRAALAKDRLQYLFK